MEIKAISEQIKTINLPISLEKRCENLKMPGGLVGQALSQEFNAKNECWGQKWIEAKSKVQFFMS